MLLSFFTDELALDLPEALPLLKSWGLTHVDLRGRVFGKAFEALTPEELKEVRKLLDAHGLKIGALQSSLAKVHLPVPERLKAEEAKLEGVIRAADALDCRLVRAFHYWQPPAELRGKLAEQPDQMQRVLDAFAPIARRAQQAGLTLAFENCGVTPDEVHGVLDALNAPNFGLAWDCTNHWDDDARKRDEVAYIVRHVTRSKMLHVKACGTLPALTASPLPWDRLLAAAQAAGMEGPVSIETHNPSGSGLTAQEACRRTTVAIQRAWPKASKLSVEEAARRPAAWNRAYAARPVGFVVVGLGMGHSRAKLLHRTSGCKLLGVVDRDEARAKRSADEFGVPFTTELEPWLAKPEVDVVYVMTPTGLHSAVGLPALEAGKHVLTTKPMEASLEACDRLIEAAERKERLLAVDFDLRFQRETLELKHAVESGAFGKLLNATAALKIRRTEAYFKASGGWRGTRRLDGGGVLSNQCIHVIDLLHFVLGLPKQVRCDIFTQAQPIEAEDFGSALWRYESGLVVNLVATSTLPHDAWYQRLEIHGTAGAFVEHHGGPSRGERLYYTGGAWSDLAPAPVSAPWACAADNMAAAIRERAALVCPGIEGRRSQAILDAMYRSAFEGGKWVDVDAGVPALAGAR
ncbi:MAG: Gfo/Idh/MocA family oxidoreductase [Planctomycetes bacterium]|nr:Gfo/Idh/MocA family oxidoreductase [Planctomycetota bacterium]